MGNQHGLDFLTQTTQPCLVSRL
ncbi:hypothetical protein F383_39051 [Gossypium arboreum]|uniref:Uncharacterized protein n=1 Tax=Gossypium arboreum TaxID=29729 RepID=A0A0B0MEW8_GOSAR|nr:hypothetical protein F383_39051 [Gossypium arboreum]